MYLYHACVFGFGVHTIETLTVRSVYDLCSQLSVMDSSFVLRLIYEDRFLFGGLVVDLQIRHSVWQKASLAEITALFV